MKKHLFFMMIAAAVLCCTCEKGEDNNDSNSGNENPQNAACDITSFTVDGVAWNIDGTNITYSYPAETPAITRTPVIVVSGGATVSPASGVAQNFFTNAGITYTVTAEDGATTKTYIAKALLQEPTVVASGTTGGCTWVLTGVALNYTLTISGNGAMGDYDTNNYYSYPPWSSYYIVKTLVIQQGVTSIGKWAFLGCAGVTEVTIPNSVTSIGEYAFASCTALTSLTIGNSVQTIGEYAFFGCSGLTGTLTIPNSVTTIDRYAFAICSSLTSLTIGNSVQTIGSSAFWGCTGITLVTSLNTDPPVLSLAFDYAIENSCTLRVPASAVNAYRNSDWRRYFSSIIGI